MLYHEHQSLYKCGVHAVNNLLGEPAFSAQDFERFATELTPGNWWNPHKAVLGLGNYDVNVLEYALLKQRVGIRWHDNREPFALPPEEDCMGLILNQAPSGWLGLVIRTRHWISIRRIDEKWWNCDSVIPAPVEIPDVNAVVQDVIDKGGYCLVASRQD